MACGAGYCLRRGIGHLIGVFENAIPPRRLWRRLERRMAFRTEGVLGADVIGLGVPGTQPAIPGEEELLCVVVKMDANGLEIMLTVRAHDEAAAYTAIGLAIVVVWPYRVRGGVGLRRLLGFRSREHTHTQQREHCYKEYAKCSTHKALAAIKTTLRRRDNRSPPTDR